MHRSTNWVLKISCLSRNLGHNFNGDLEQEIRRRFGTKMTWREGLHVASVDLTAATHMSRECALTKESSASTACMAAFGCQKYKHLLHSGVSHTVDRQIGTVRHQHCETVTYHYTHSSSNWKSYLSAAWTPSGAFTALLRVWRCYIRLLTYLFTYLTPETIGAKPIEKNDQSYS